MHPFAAFEDLLVSIENQMNVKLSEIIIDGNVYDLVFKYIW